MSNDVINLDGSSGNFTLDHSISITNRNITFTSYNGVATLFGYGEYSKLLIIDSLIYGQNKMLIVIENIKFFNVTVANIGSVFGGSFYTNAHLKVINCQFEFQIKTSERQPEEENWFVRNLFFIIYANSLMITVEKCIIKANYQVGILHFAERTSCLWMRSFKVSFRDTKIHDSRYCIYAALPRCNDNLGSKKFHIHVVNSSVTSNEKRQFRTPQFGIIIGKLFKTRIWLVLRFEDSRFENISVNRQTSAIMDIRGPSVVLIKNCFFQRNKGYRGGALSLQSSFVNVDYSVFKENVAQVSSVCSQIDLGGNGGAIYSPGVDGPMKLNISNCLFINNSADCLGESFYGGYFFSFSVRDTLFLTDPSLGSSEALWVSYSDKLLLNNVSFEATDIGRLDSTLFIARSKVFSYEERKPFFRCPMGSILNSSVRQDTQTVKCKSCPQNSYTLEKSSGFMLTANQSLKDKQRTQCKTCSFGAVCNKGIKAKPNFWGYVFDNTAIMLICPQGYCCQTQSECTSMQNCNGMREGKLCGRCKKGFFQSVLTSDCFHDRYCKPWRFWAWLVLYCLLFIVLLCFLQDIINKMLKLINSTRKTSDKNRLKISTRASLLRDMGDESGTVLDEVTNEGNDDTTSDKNDDCVFEEKEADSDKNSTPGGLIKIVFFFYQVNTILSTYKSEQKVKQLKHIKRFIGGLFNLDLQTAPHTEFLCPVKSMDGTTKVFVKAFLPVNCLLLALLIYALLSMKTSFFKCHDKMQQRCLALKSKCRKAMLQLILLGYSTITSGVLSLLTCVNLKTGEKVLFIDGTISCYRKWQYLLFAFTLLWTLPLILALHRLPKCKQTGKISMQGFFAALILPLPFCIYSILEATHRKATAYFQRNIQETALSPNEVPFIPILPERDVNKSLQELVDVIEGPFRYVTTNDQRKKLSWEPVLLLQRFLLLLCHTFVLQPGKRSLILLLLVVIFSKLNIYYRPFCSSSLNILNDVIFGLLCVSGIINAVHSYIYEYGSIPQGPLIQLLMIFDYLELAILLIIPSFILIVAAAKLVYILAKTAGKITTRCHSFCTMQCYTMSE